VRLAESLTDLSIDRRKKPRHREPPLGGVAIQGHLATGAAALDCLVAKRLLAMAL
jgi:hypothetical protein